MAWMTDEIYRSPNEDVWQLLREAPSGTILVRHVPNRASGGTASDLPVEEFLALDGCGPEHGALRALLARLAAPEPGHPGSA